MPSRGLGSRTGPTMGALGPHRKVGAGYGVQGKTGLGQVASTKGSAKYQAPRAQGMASDPRQPQNDARPRNAESRPLGP